MFRMECYRHPRLQLLQEFKRQHGHCRVWVNHQRQEYQKLKERKKACITLERTDLLDSIGFQMECYRHPRVY